MRRALTDHWGYKLLSLGLAVLLYLFARGNLGDRPPSPPPAASAPSAGDH